MRILFVSAYFSYPAATRAGRSDLFHLIQALSPHHEIHLLSFVEASELEYIETVRSYVRSLSVIVAANTWQERFSSALRGLRENPLLIGQRGNHELRFKMTEIIEKYDIELVQFEWTEAAQFLNSIIVLNRKRLAQGGSRVYTILDEVEIAFQSLQREWQLAGNPIAKVEGWRRYEEMRRRELAWCRGMDGILTRSSADCTLLLSLLPDKKPVYVLHPWVPIHEYTDIPLDPGVLPLLMLDGADSDSVQWFYKLVYPLLKERYPTIQSLINVSNASSQVQALAEADSSISLTCEATGLKQDFMRSSIFIAPSQRIGFAHHMIAALAAGRPVVATYIANRAICAPDQQAILLADDPQLFANHILALLNDQQLWKRVAHNGRVFARCTFDYPASIAGLETFYNEVVTHHES